MNLDYYRQYEPFFGSWYITRLIGEGNFGKVYEVQREDFGTTYRAALKVMTIPQNESEIKSIMADGMDAESVKYYYKNFVEDVVKEFVLMSKLKGNSNIVSYEDHMVIEHRDKIGWDILIRMEILTPMIDYVKSIDLKTEDVIKLGIDMCRALELCQKHKIIHRDIKPENIFVSDNGDYKLGDFGIARTLEQTTSMLSKKGTHSYMAPEIYKEDSYLPNVDIYSLGIVMYRLLNANRTPFLPPYPNPITHSDREMAIKKRINGEPLPVPIHATGKLADVVLKACAYNPYDRYMDPADMRRDLESILHNDSHYFVPAGSHDSIPMNSLGYLKEGGLTFLNESGSVQKPPVQAPNPPGDDRTEVFTPEEAHAYYKNSMANNHDEAAYHTGDGGDDKKKSNTLIVLLVAVIAIVAIAGVAIGVLGGKEEAQPVIVLEDLLNIPHSVEIAEGESILLEPICEPTEATEDVVEFSVEDDGIVVLNGNEIEAKKIGETVVIVKCGEIIKTIRVNVKERVDVDKLLEDFASAWQYYDTVAMDESIDLTAIEYELTALQMELAVYNTDEFEDMKNSELEVIREKYDEVIVQLMDELGVVYDKAVEDAKAAEAAEAAKASSSKKKTDSQKEVDNTPSFNGNIPIIDTGILPQGNY